MLCVQKKKCRVHSLTGRITNPLMLKAFKAVKRNRGAAGIDKQSIRMFESNLYENLSSLMRELKTGTYQPIPLKRVYVPKGKGKLRPLGIPSVRCRVAQEVVRSLINPIFDAEFHHNSHGFRAKRGCHTAIAQIVKYHKMRHRVVLDADVKGFFDILSKVTICDFISQFFRHYKKGIRA